MADRHNKRGKKFSIEQDIAICRAWLAITEDGIVGTNQSSDTYWSRILENYMEQCSDLRTAPSIRARWGTIMKCCNKYRGCIAQIENQHPSGANQVDIINRAQMLYNEFEKKPFTLGHCWEILQNSAKWSDTSSTATIHMDTSSNLDSPVSQTPNNFIHVDTESTPIRESVESPTKRPIGIKRAKEAILRRKSDEAFQTRFMAGFDEMNKNVVAKEAAKRADKAEKATREERKIAAMELYAQSAHLNAQIAEKKQEDEIMRMDTSNMSPVQREYYEMRQRDIRAKLSGSSSSGDYYQPVLDFD